MAYMQMYFINVPEYYRGYAALEAELENLNQRNDNDISLYDENYSREHNYYWTL